VDIDSFSNAAPEVQKEVIPDAAVEPPVAATDTTVPQSVHPHDEASPNLPRSLNSPFKGVKIPSKMLPYSKFARKCLKAKLPLLPWPHLTRALVRLTVANY
jgi:hypothetical protein